MKANGESSWAEATGQSSYGLRDMRPDKRGRNKRTVWRINTKPFAEAHFAVFPKKLCETPIKAGCPVGGVVLDPFFGSGTTGLVALEQQKRFVGVELNPEYIKIANKRLKPHLEQTELLGFDGKKAGDIIGDFAEF